MYNSYDTSNAVGVLMGGMAIFFGIIFVICIAAAVCALVGQWKVLKKAGKGGWEALIPYYNTVVLCNISGISPWWVLIVPASGIVLGFIPYIGPLVSSAISIYFLVILNVSIVRSFGKDDAFAVGLVLLAPVFWLILAKQDNQYLGPKPINDPIWKFIDEKILNNSGNNNQNSNYNPNMNNGTPVQPATKFCTNCGYKVSNGETRCPSCGKEIQ